MMESMAMPEVLWVTSARPVTGRPAAWGCTVEGINVRIIIIEE